MTLYLNEEAEGEGVSRVAAAAAATPPTPAHELRGRRGSVT